MRAFVTVIILLSCIMVWGQTKSLPLVIQGQISNSPERKLKIFFLDKNGETVLDTIQLDNSGRFYLKTYKINQPQKTSIQWNATQINDFYVAPGYDLKITADASDFISLLKTTKIEGIGFESNQYRAILLANLIERMDTTRWYELNEKDLLSYLKRKQQSEDSIMHVVFDKKPIQDKYLKYFGNLVKLDNMFSRLNMLLDHINHSNFNYEKSISFLRSNFDNKILDNIYQEAYLQSEGYKYLIANEWLTYLIRLDAKKDTTHVMNEMHGPDRTNELYKINELYKGKVKEYVLYHKLQLLVDRSKSLAELGDCQKKIASYGLNLQSPYYKQSLLDKALAKEQELIRTQVGKPAPKFSLKSNLGELVQLDDLKGKVVYIDLWASWCTPCRAENPSFKLLYDKYRNDNRIAFVGIAVHDGRREWEKALQEDKPEWIQLLDSDGVVARSYAAWAIPRFVLVDKLGNIASFDAPRPSDMKELEYLLRSEMEK